MTHTITNPFLYCQVKDEQVLGINRTYVDDLLRAETNENQTHSEASPERFKRAENKQTQ